MSSIRAGVGWADWRWVCGGAIALLALACAQSGFAAQKGSGGGAGGQVSSGGGGAKGDSGTGHVSGGPTDKGGAQPGKDTGGDDSGGSYGGDGGGGGSGLGFGWLKRIFTLPSHRSGPSSTSPPVRGPDGFHSQPGTPYHHGPTIQNRDSGNHNWTATSVKDRPKLEAPRMGSLETVRGVATIGKADGWRTGYWGSSTLWHDGNWYADFYSYQPAPKAASPSLYYPYNSVPGYVQASRVSAPARHIYAFAGKRGSDSGEQEGYTDVRLPFVYCGKPTGKAGLAHTALDLAISDIVDAWMTGNPAVIERHILPDEQVAIFLDGEFAYAMDSADYAAITRDAVQAIQTKSFAVTRVARRSPTLVVLYARHTFADAPRIDRAVYVAYTLEQVGDDWFIVEAGSSQNQFL